MASNFITADRSGSWCSRERSRSRDSCGPTLPSRSRRPPTDPAGTTQPTSTSTSLGSSSRPSTSTTGGSVPSAVHTRARAVPVPVRTGLRPARPPTPPRFEIPWHEIDHLLALVETREAAIRIYERGGLDHTIVDRERHRPRQELAGLILWRNLIYASGVLGPQILYPPTWRRGIPRGE